MQNTTKKLTVTSMLAALVCVATMVIKIPSPLGGYINLGDCIVLLCGWLLPPVYAFLAAAVGSGLADVFSGYVSYAPATFIIKGLMALAALYIFKISAKKIKKTPSHILSGVTAEIIMVLGYFIFEGFLYGFVPSLVNIPPNAVQGIAGIILACLLIKIFERTKIFD